jgi:hypothetical protein
VYGDRTRTGWLHLGDWANIAAAGRQRVRQTIMGVQCVGSRMDNGGRILEAARRHPATE